MELEPISGISFKDSAFSNMNQIASLKPKQDEITCMSWASEDQVRNYFYDVKIVK